MFGAALNSAFAALNLWAYFLDGNALAPGNMFVAGMNVSAVLVCLVMKANNELA